MKPVRYPRRWGRWVSVAILGLLAWQQTELVGGQLRVAAGLLPVIQTYMEMSAYRGRLATEIEASDTKTPPADLRAWLNAGFRGAGKEPGVDYFGVPYVAESEAGRARLRSCGPDRRCGTADDIVLDL